MTNTIIIGDSGLESTLTLGGTNTISTTINSAPTGTMNIGTGARGGTINIGTGSTGPINIGVRNDSTLIGTPLTLNGSTIAIEPVKTQNMNIATTGERGGTINIGTGAGSTGPINIGVKNDTTTIGTPLTLNGSTIAIEPVKTQNMSIATAQTTGILNIGTGTRTGTGSINIGTGASSTNNINIGGGVGSTGTINIGQVGGVTGGTTTNINTSTVGNHPVNIGSSSSTTTIGGQLSVTGKLNASIGTISGNLAYLEYDTSNASLSRTIDCSTLNLNAVIVFFSGAIPPGTYTLSNVQENQIITLKNWNNNDAPVPIQFSSQYIYSYGIDNVGATINTISLARGDSITLQRALGKIYQFASGSSFPIGITLPTKAITPTITQLGYTSSVTNASAISISAPATLSAFIGTGVSLPKGVCLMSFVCTATFTPASSASSMTMTFLQSAGLSLTSFTANNSLIMVGNSTKTTFMFTSIYVNTNYAGLGEVTWQVTPSAITTNVSVAVGDAKIAWVKIA